MKMDLFRCNSRPIRRAPVIEAAPGTIVPPVNGCGVRPGS
jgi:hypothetical protein